MGDTLAETFADVGSAGGHSEMAGGEVPLGIFAGYENTELVGIVDRVVSARLVEALNLDRPDND